MSSLRSALALTFVAAMSSCHEAPATAPVVSAANPAAPPNDEDDDEDDSALLTQTMDPDEQNHTALCGAHILITYDKAEAFASILPRPPVPSTRSRKEAQRLATELAAKARAAPGSFAELARVSSDDIYTRGRGGQFGVTGPASLPETVADAFLRMHDGEVRGPVESPVGFHVLMRLPVPPPQKLSGRTLVVAYAGSPDILFGDEEHTASRTRDQAKARAVELLALARQHPASFADLIRRESDGMRAADGGYLGVWTTTDPLSRTPILSLPLLDLSVGELSGVVETPFGFQIFQRLPPTPAERRAASALIIPFGPAVTRTAALARARAIVETLRRSGARAGASFAQYRTEPGILLKDLPAWSRGDEPAALDVALDGVAVGGFSEPFVLDDQVVIVKRNAVR